MSTVRVVIDHAALQRLLQGTDGPVAKDIVRRCVQIDRAAKGFCPVDTGRLRSSINHRLATDAGGLVGIVGTNVDYAPYVEFGTRYMRAQSFLRRALSAA